jgi:ribonuclease HI
MGSGSAPHEALAVPLGRWLATQDVHLLTGGGAGVMEAVSRAFYDTAARRGAILAILPAADATSGAAPDAYPNPWVEIPIRTHLPMRGSDGAEPLSRNHVNVLTSDVLIALPGHAGTASEIALALRYGRPVFVHAPSRDDIPELPAAVPHAPTLEALMPLVSAALERVRGASAARDTMHTRAGRDGATALPQPEDARVQASRTGSGSREAEQYDVGSTEGTEVTIYTDGACRGNPGPGGWGAVLIAGERRRTLYGGDPQTTNNRMELLAAIRALEALTRRCRVSLITDSEYLKNGITSWLRAWRARGWKTASGTPVKNRDLWEQLDAAARKHDVTWRWVRGHTGDPGNEEADRLARRGIDELS